MSQIKNIPNSKMQLCYEDAEMRLGIFDFKNCNTAEGLNLSKSQVHFLFCLNADVHFQFNPNYGRNLAQNRAYIIHNPEMDIPVMLQSPEAGLLISLSIKLSGLHQLFVPESHAAPIFNPANIQLKSYEEIEIIPELMILLINLAQKSNVNRLYYKAKILEILSIIYSEKPQNENHCPFLKNESTVRKIRAAKELLLNNYKKPMTIPALAKAVQLNELQLKVGFKEIYGESPYHFLMIHKLEIAKQLLLNGKHQVQEVAHEIGYSNTSHFIEAFKKQFGITPKRVMG